jgi:hypothetical protein
MITKNRFKILFIVGPEPEPHGNLYPDPEQLKYDAAPLNSYLMDHRFTVDISKTARKF